jgi:hypothetical protein
VSVSVRAVVTSVTEVGAGVVVSVGWPRCRAPEVQSRRSELHRQAVDSVTRVRRSWSRAQGAAAIAALSACGVQA